MKKLFTLFLALVASIGTLFAESGTCGENVTWDFTDGVLTISGTGAMTNYNTYAFYIPWYSQRENITSIVINDGVTSIGEKAFVGCTSLTSVTIPNSVTYILYGAFYDCSSLPSVTIPNSVTWIGEVAFYNCSNLTSITLPSSVTSIGSRAFDDCSQLSSIYISDITAWCNLYLPKSDSWYTWTKYDLYLNGTLVEDLVLPNNVQSIQNCAFENCRSLKTIVMPNCVKSIGERAFVGCINLTSVVLGDSIEDIGAKAFSGLTNLTTINFPPSLKRIGSYAFYQCSNLSIENVIFPNGIETIGGSAFYECTSLTGTLVIPEGMTSISSSAFRKCAFSNIILPSTLEEIGSCAFYNNRGGGIKHLVIPDNVTRIGSEAFYYDGIAKLTIGKKVTTIENGAFYYAGWCPLDTIIWNAENGPNPFYYYTSGGGNANTIRTNIKHITIGEEVQTVPSALFEDLPNLNSIEWNAKHVEAVSSVRGTTTNVKKVIFTPTCEYIPANFCSQMKNLQDLYLPNTITEIGKDAFMWCSGLENIHYDGTLSDWCSGILADLMTRWKGGNILLGTDTLKELIVPEDITAIVAHRFEKCKSLTSVYVPDHVQTIDEAAFSNCENVKSVILGNGLTSLPASTFSNCKALTTLTLGKNIKTIYDNAFYGCENIEVIYNYREKPGVLYSTSFDGVDKFSCILYVPAGSLAMYKAAAGWKDFFDIREMGGGVESNIVQVVTTDNTATFNWNNIAEVNTYTLVIWADAEQTELFCSLTFNALGYLININFGSTINRAPAHTNNLSGLSFTVTGLEENHLYNYEFKALAANNDILDNKQGTFVTDGQTYTEAIDQITNDQSSINKVMMDGQIYILRGDKTYTLTGQEVR